MSPDSLGKAALIVAVALFALILITIFLPYGYNPYPVIAVGITSIVAVFILGLGLFSAKS
ncbi:MAG: hypothetical protein QXV32_04830 [Conexivisphaerales archaeon]